MPIPTSAEAKRNERKRNAERHITAIITDYYDAEEEQNSVVSLLADLRHYCETHGINFNDVSRFAQQTAKEEGTEP